MITLCLIAFIIFVIWATFKILPAIIGLVFSIILGILQILCALFFIPLIGLGFILIDFIVIGGIIGLIKKRI